MVKVKYLLLFLSILITSTILSSETYAVVGGTNAPVDYSWSVAFVKPNDGSPVESRVECTGVLISSKWIATAYHCWNEINGTNAVIGRSDLADASVGEKRYVSSPDFYRGTAAILADHDVMLVRLSSPSTQVPIQLASSSESNAWNVGSELRIYGYGCTREGATGGSRYLKRANFNIMTFSPTGTIATELKLNAPFGMALRGMNGGSCNADSGAPYITSSVNGPRVVGINNASNKFSRDSSDTTSIAAKLGYRSSSSNSPLYLAIYETMSRFP